MINNYVIRFQIPKNNISLVQIFQRQYDLSQIYPHLKLRQSIIFINTSTFSPSTIILLDPLLDNNPRSIRDVTEKLSILNFKEFTPDTMVSSIVDDIVDFIAKHNVAILKPLYDCAGQGVIKVEYDGQNTTQNIDSIVKQHGYLMLQEYLPNIVDFGDKRVMFLDGEILGVINRKAKQGEFRVNMIMGGKSYKTSLTQKEQRLCIEVGKFLKDNDLFLVGIDIIDEKLIEINVTSPTGLVAIKNLYKIDVEKIIIDKIETKLKSCYSAG